VLAQLIRPVCPKEPLVDLERFSQPVIVQDNHPPTVIVSGDIVAVCFDVVDSVEIGCPENDVGYTFTFFPKG